MELMMVWFCLLFESLVMNVWLILILVMVIVCSCDRLV